MVLCENQLLGGNNMNLITKYAPEMIQVHNNGYFA